VNITIALGRKWYADEVKRIHQVVDIRCWIDCRILDLEHPEIALRKLILDGMLPLV
jgi:hypothetical protein